MEEEVITYHPAQAELAGDTHRFRVGNCGRRFGKTFLAGQEIHNVAVHTKNGRIAYIANTYQQAKDIAWEELKEITKDSAIKTNESELSIVVRSTYPRRDSNGKLVLTEKNEPIMEPSTSTIRLRGWESVNNLRGQKFHFIVLDEVAFMKEFQTTWNKVLLPALTDYHGDALFLSTPNGFNHFYDLFNRENKDKDYKSFHFPSRLNPYLKGEVIDKARAEMTEDEFAQEYEAEFRKKEGLVFKIFNRKHHVYNPDELNTKPNLIETFYGIDFGFSNPAAILKIQKDNDANYWITEEYYERGKTTPQLVEIARGMTPQPRCVYPDPAEPDRLLEFKQAGFYVREVKKGKKSIANGVSRLQELFKTNRIKISTECLNLIEELEMYSYPSSKEGRNDDENPIPENDHAIDAMRYALVTHDPVSHGTGSVFTPNVAGGTDIQNELRRRAAKNNQARRSTLLK